MKIRWVGSVEALDPPRIQRNEETPNARSKYTDHLAGASAMKWFRFYADALRNPKVAQLSDREFRLWVSLLSVAAENDGIIPPLEQLKHVLKARLDHLSTALERLIILRLIDRSEGHYTPHSWDKFQYKSDTSTPRVTLHRAKGETAPEQIQITEQINTPIVPSSGDGRVRKVRKANGHDQEAYEEFEETVWADFPRHPNSRKEPAFIAYQKLPVELRGKCIGGAIRYAERFRNTEERGRSETDRLRYVPHLSTWIHQRGWESEYDRES